MVICISGAYEQLIEHLCDDGYTQSHTPIPLVDSSESSINNMALILFGHLKALTAVQRLVWFGKIARQGEVE